MAYTTLTVLDTDKVGDELIALMVGSDTQAGDGFEFVNDGRTIIFVLDELAAGAGDTITFEGVTDSDGRSETTLTRTVTAKKLYFYGPFLPDIWNQAGNLVKFKFTTANSKTKVMVARISNPS